MSDVRTLLERAYADATPPPDGFERMLRRRDRKRRNQRLTAGVLGIAIFVAAVWMVTGGPFDRTRSSVVPGGVGTIGPSLTGPAVTGPAATGPVDEGIVIPPAGAQPSAPAEGRLVLEYHGRPTILGTIGPFKPWYSLFVYEDGRVIWDHVESDSRLPLAASGFSTGLIEQRLTPEGVQMVVDEVRSSGLLEGTLRLFSGENFHYGWIIFYGDQGPRRLFWHTPARSRWAPGGTLVGGGGSLRGDDPDRYQEATPEQAAAIERLSARLADPGAWLPERAWADPTPRAYVASAYRVCAYQWDPSETVDNPTPPVDPAEIVALLPKAARAILAEPSTTYAGHEQGCYVVPLDRARALSQVLAGDRDRWEGQGVIFETDTPEFESSNAGVDFTPILPR